MTDLDANWRDRALKAETTLDLVTKERDEWYCGCREAEAERDALAKRCDGTDAELAQDWFNKHQALRAKLDIAVEALKHFREGIDASASNLIEPYCDVNPEDCDHCELLGLIDDALAKIAAKEGG